MKFSELSFVSILYSVLNDLENHNTIHWNTEGNELQIKDIIDFKMRILPCYFPGMNLKIFLKRLRRNSFHRKVVHGCMFYSHPFFKQDQPQLIQDCFFCQNASRKKNKFNEEMMLRLNTIESSYTRIEESVVDLERKYERTISLNKILLKELNSTFLKKSEDYENLLRAFNL